MALISSDSRGLEARKRICLSLQLLHLDAPASSDRSVHGWPDNDSARSNRSAEPPIGFALRISASALAALAIADLLNISHPWWAAMSAWLVTQPSRRLLLERSFFRLLGTACGGLAATAILLALPQRPLLSISAVTSWLALCATLGSFFRHFRSYGFVLAGYTAAIIVLFSLDGTSTFGVAVDRLLCTVIGIACSSFAAVSGLPVGIPRQMMDRTGELLQGCLDCVEAYLRGGSSKAWSDALIRDIAALDRILDEQSAGSLHRHRDALRVRRICGLMLELIALMSRGRAGRPRERTACPGSVLHRISELSALASSSNERGLANALDDISQVLRSPKRLRIAALTEELDVIFALRAALRPSIAVGIGVAVWWGTGWQAGNMTIMTAALFATLFSSHDQGNQALIQALLGSLLGAVAGLFCRTCLLPLAHGICLTLLCIAPFLLLGALLTGHHAAAKLATDFNMTFLLIAQPTSPPVAAGVVLDQAAAMLAGVLAVAATYWLFLPATPQVRARLLLDRVARLTLRIGESRTATAASAALRRLSATQLRLLEFVEPASRAFSATQNCLAEARCAVAGWSHAAASEGFSRSGENALRRASAALTACITSV